MLGAPVARHAGGRGGARLRQQAFDEPSNQGPHLRREPVGQRAHELGRRAAARVGVGGLRVGANVIHMVEVERVFIAIPPGQGGQDDGLHDLGQGGASVGGEEGGMDATRDSGQETGRSSRQRVARRRRAHRHQHAPHVAREVGEVGREFFFVHFNEKVDVVADGRAQRVQRGHAAVARRRRRGRALQRQRVPQGGHPAIQGALKVFCEAGRVEGVEDAAGEAGGVDRGDGGALVGRGGRRARCIQRAAQGGHQGGHQHLGILEFGGESVRHEGAPVAFVDGVCGDEDAVGSGGTARRGRQTLHQVRQQLWPGSRKVVPADDDQGFRQLGPHDGGRGQHQAGEKGLDLGAVVGRQLRWWWRRVRVGVGGGRRPRRFDRVFEVDGGRLAQLDGRVGGDDLGVEGRGGRVGARAGDKKRHALLSLLPFPSLLPSTTPAHNQAERQLL